MTNEPHLWEKLRAAAEPMDATLDLTKRIDLLLDNASVHAYDACWSAPKATLWKWHDIALEHVRTLLRAKSDRELLNWFAQHGVTP